jgi:hypothetical protein
LRGLSLRVTAEPSGLSALAELIEPDVSPWMQTDFGRTNVGIWRVSIGLELGDGGKVNSCRSRNPS